MFIMCLQANLIGRLKNMGFLERKRKVIKTINKLLSNSKNDMQLTNNLKGLGLILMCLNILDFDKIKK